VVTADFAPAYADQTEHDYAAFRSAIERDLLPCETGI